MKTKNNVQKTILRSAAVIISFVLVSYTVSAQEFWKKLIENSSFNEIAIAMIVDSNKTKTTANSNKDVQSTQVDDKMKHNELKTLRLLPLESTFWLAANETEQAVEYMSKPGLPKFNNSLVEIAQSIEEPLKLEYWMTSDETWNQ
jgi:hypothetical protein